MMAGKKHVFPWLAAAAVASAALAANIRWLVVASPNASATNYLLGTAALAPSDVWAVGYYYASSGVQMTLTEHWNGATWALVPSPNPGIPSNCSPGYQGSALTAAGGISASDIWAVGYNCSWQSRTLAEHWNGSQWSAVSSPDASSSALPAAGVRIYLG